MKEPVYNLSKEERLVIAAWRQLDDEWRYKFSQFFAIVTDIIIPIEKPKQEECEIIQFPGRREE